MASSSSAVPEAAERGEQRPRGGAGDAEEQHHMAQGALGGGDGSMTAKVGGVAEPVDAFVEDDAERAAGHKQGQPAGAIEPAFTMAARATSTTVAGRHPGFG